MYIYINIYNNLKSNYLFKILVKLVSIIFLAEVKFNLMETNII